jgi:hypothetical protein
MLYGKRLFLRYRKGLGFPVHPVRYSRFDSYRDVRIVPHSRCGTCYRRCFGVTHPIGISKSLTDFRTCLNRRQIVRGTIAFAGIHYVYLMRIVSDQILFTGVCSLNGLTNCVRSRRLSGRRNVTHIVIGCVTCIVRRPRNVIIVRRKASFRRERDERGRNTMTDASVDPVRLRGQSNNGDHMAGD